MREQDVHTFTILFHLKTMTATTFNIYQVWECCLDSPLSFDHKMTASNFKLSSIQPEIGHPEEAVFLMRDIIKTWMESHWKQGIKMLLASIYECLIEVGFDMEDAFTNKIREIKLHCGQGRWSDGGWVQTVDDLAHKSHMLNIWLSKKI